MTRRLLVLIVVSAGLLLAGSRLEPSDPPVQMPPAGPPPVSQAPPTVTEEEVVSQVNAFYARYWKAWDDHDIKGIEDGLDPSFVSYLYVAPKGLMQADKEASMAGVRQFFDSVRGQQMLWRRTLLTVEPRTPTEVIAAVRNDFSLAGGAGGEIEITLEVVRRSTDGRWRLLRKWSEKRPY